MRLIITSTPVSERGGGGGGGATITDTKCGTCTCSWLNNTQNFAFSFLKMFAVSRLCHAYVRKDTRSSPAFLYRMG